MSNVFDPDQKRTSVSLKLGPNCLQRLSADDKSCRQQGKRLGKNVLVAIIEPTSDILKLVQDKILSGLI